MDQRLFLDMKDGLDSGDQNQYMAHFCAKCLAVKSVRVESAAGGHYECPECRCKEVVYAPTARFLTHHPGNFAGGQLVQVKTLEVES